MGLTIILWALGAVLLILFFGMLLSAPRGISALVEHGLRRKPPESPLARLVEEHRRHRDPRGS